MTCGYEMYCHDVEVMSSNPGRVELGSVVFPFKLYFIPNDLIVIH